MLSNRLYDALKFVAQILLPALGTLYFSLAGLWNLPSAHEVSGTVLAFDTFLGVFLGVNSKIYNNSDAKFDGHLNINHAGDKKVFDLTLKSEPEGLEGKDEVLFKVNKHAK